MRIVDIACGDGHCLALSHGELRNLFIHLSKHSVSDNEVYSWGTNAMGQCGLGNTNSPIIQPSKVTGLEGIVVHQISAGTSHSLAWTALPLDR